MGKKQEWTNRRKERLNNIVSSGSLESWNKHSDYHYSKIIAGSRIDVWPSSHKFKVKGKIYSDLDFRGLGKKVAQRIADEDFSIVGYLGTTN